MLKGFVRGVLGNVVTRIGAVASGYLLGLGVPDDAVKQAVAGVTVIVLFLADIMVSTAMKKD